MPTMVVFRISARVVLPVMMSNLPAVGFMLDKDPMVVPASHGYWSILAVPLACPFTEGSGLDYSLPNRWTSTSKSGVKSLAAMKPEPEKTPIALSVTWPVATTSPNASSRSTRGIPLWHLLSLQGWSTLPASSIPVASIPVLMWN